MSIPSTTVGVIDGNWSVMDGVGVAVEVAGIETVCVLVLDATTLLDNVSVTSIEDSTCMVEVDVTEDEIISEDGVTVDNGGVAEGVNRVGDNGIVEEGVRYELVSLMTVGTSDNELTDDVVIVTTDEVSTTDDDDGVTEINNDGVSILTDVIVGKPVAIKLLEISVVVLMDNILLVLLAIVVAVVVVSILIVLKVLVDVGVGVGVTVVEMSHSSKLLTSSRGSYPVLAIKVMLMFSTATSSLPG